MGRNKGERRSFILREGKIGYGKRSEPVEERMCHSSPFFLSLFSSPLLEFAKKKKEKNLQKSRDGRIGRGKEGEKDPIGRCGLK